MHIFAVAVALCAGMTYVHAQGKAKCHEPGVALQDGEKARLCYGSDQDTEIRLSCDYGEPFGFKLHVIPDRDAKEIVRPNQEVKGFRSASQSNPAPRSIIELATGRVDGCPNQPRPYEWPYHFNDPIVDFEIKSDGRAYYTTTVVLTEYHFTDASCTRARFYITDIDLECCAIPQPTPNDTITVPLHKECDLDKCEVGAQFDCKCRNGAGSDSDQWEIEAKSTLDFTALGPNVGFQFLSMVAHLPLTPDQKPSDVTNLPYIVDAIPVDHSAAPHLEVSHSYGADWHKVLTNVFSFHSNHEDRVWVTCGATYCRKDPALPISDYLNHLPACVDQPTATYFGPRSLSS